MVATDHVQTLYIGGFRQQKGKSGRECVVGHVIINYDQV